jgi:hypothetical protein
VLFAEEFLSWIFAEHTIDLYIQIHCVYFYVIRVPAKNALIKKSTVVFPCKNFIREPVPTLSKPSNGRKYLLKTAKSVTTIVVAGSKNGCEKNLVQQCSLISFFRNPIFNHTVLLCYIDEDICKGEPRKDHLQRLHPVNFVTG